MEKGKGAIPAGPLPLFFRFIFWHNLNFTRGFCETTILDDRSITVFSGDAANK
jgi:hypothetical protein